MHSTYFQTSSNWKVVFGILAFTTISASDLDESEDEFDSELRLVPLNLKTKHDFLNCSCGHFLSERKIIDGEAIKDAEFPWLVGILSGGGSSLMPLCYGSLISDRHILTATSCVLKKQPHEITAYLHGKEFSQRRRRTISRIVLHHAYTSRNHDNNLALLTLALPLKLEDMRRTKISPICIPNPYIFSGKLNRMKGIMIKRQEHKTGGKYYFGTVPVRIYGTRNKYCSNIFSERPNNKVLCYDFHKQPSCYGDLGSPLTITVSKTGQSPVSVGGRYYLLGVYSRGYGCDGYQKGKSGVDVSTNILNHTDWLIKNTRDGYFCS